MDKTDYLENELLRLEHCLKKILVCRRLHLYWTSTKGKENQGWLKKWQRIENSWEKEVLFVKIGVKVGLMAQ